MTSPVFTVKVELPPVCTGEVLRYAGCAGAEEYLPLVHECAAELAPLLRPAVCAAVTDVKIDGDTVDLSFTKVRSAALAKNLAGCTGAVIFAATAGLAPDRASELYGRRMPARALFCDAVGSERVEALCDSFVSFFERERGVALRPRFSPGYGDVPLEVQKDFFALLDCPRKIGLTLNASLMMTPTKSVTAIAGIIN